VISLSVLSRGLLVWCLAELGKFAERIGPAREALEIGQESDQSYSISACCTARWTCGSGWSRRRRRWGRYDRSECSTKRLHPLRLPRRFVSLGPGGLPYASRSIVFMIWYRRPLGEVRARLLGPSQAPACPCDGLDLLLPLRARRCRPASPLTRHGTDLRLEDDARDRVLFPDRRHVVFKLCGPGAGPWRDSCRSTTIPRSRSGSVADRNRRSCPGRWRQRCS
jgi:hypothetical protein